MKNSNWFEEWLINNTEEMEAAVDVKAKFDEDDSCNIENTKITKKIRKNGRIREIDYVVKMRHRINNKLERNYFIMDNGRIFRIYGPKNPYMADVCVWGGSSFLKDVKKETNRKLRRMSYDEMSMNGAGYKKLVEGKREFF